MLNSKIWLQESATTKMEGIEQIKQVVHYINSNTFRIYTLYINLFLQDFQFNKRRKRCLNISIYILSHQTRQIDQVRDLQEPVLPWITLYCLTEEDIHN